MSKGERVGKFWFSEGMPEEVKGACKDLLIDNEHLIPNWCNEVRVFWDCSGEESSVEGSSNLTAAYIETNYSYRFASLSICPAFLLDEPEDRANRIKHELCHIVSSPLINYIREVAGIVAEEEITSKVISRELTEKMESMTEDLTMIVEAIENKFSKKSSK